MVLKERKEMGNKIRDKIRIDQDYIITCKNTIDISKQWISEHEHRTEQLKKKIDELSESVKVQEAATLQYNEYIEEAEQEIKLTKAGMEEAKKK